MGDPTTFTSPGVHSNFFSLVQHGSGKYSWRFDPDGTDSLSDTENTELMRMAFQYACSPGKMGAMSTGAAANDPIFWPLHPTFAGYGSTFACLRTTRASTTLGRTTSRATEGATTTYCRSGTSSARSTATITPTPSSTSYCTQRTRTCPTSMTILIGAIAHLDSHSQ